MRGPLLNRRWLSPVGLAVLACAPDASTDPRGAGEPGAGVESLAPEAAQFPIASSSNNDELSYSVAFDGVGYLVGYMNVAVPSGNSTMKARTVSAAGGLGAPISTGRIGYSPPFVAFDGTNYLMVWLDRTLANPDVRGQFVSTGGAKVGGIVKITTTHDVAALTGLSFGGGQYLVTFSRLFAGMSRRFISPAGVVGSVRSLTTPPASSRSFSSLATDGTDFLAAWRGGPQGQSIVARLVRGNGSLGPPTTVDPGSANTFDFITTTFAGGTYLVVWTDNGVYARRVTAAGVATGARIDVAGPPILNNGMVVASGGNFAVELVEGSGTSRKIKLQLVDPAGALLNGQKTLFSASPTVTPTLGTLLANGSNFLLVNNRFTSVSSDVYGKFVTITP